MSGSTLSNYAIPPTALRVFFGFRHPDLTQDRFQQELGRTFMPGTPYMLQPLGLAAYLPAAVPEQQGVPCPHEAAIIAYRTPEDYRRIMNDTLRGRVYAQSHGGVYQRGRSRAAFPTALDPATDTPAFFLWNRSTDWQEGETAIHFGVKGNSSQTPEAFRETVRTQLTAAAESMARSGIDQCIGALAEEFVVLWTHRSETGGPPFDLSGTASSVSPVFSSVMEQVICRDEPPPVTVAGPVAYNFIFLRDERWFQR